MAAAIAAGFSSVAMGEETSPSSGTEAALMAAAALAEGDVTTVQGCTPDSSDAVEVSTSECSSSRCTTKKHEGHKPTYPAKR